MLKIKEKSSDITESNLVFLIEKKEEISILDFLKLDKKIIEKIKKTIKEKKSKTEDFYLWWKNYERLYVFYYSKSDKIEKNDFLGKEFKKLPDNFTILSNNNENIEDLLNNSLLSRYKYREFLSEKKEDKIYLLVDNKWKEIAEERLKTIKNIVFARDLSSMPSNYLYPKTFVESVEKEKFKNIKLKVLDEKKLKKEGLNLITTVWQWSDKSPYMIILERIIDKKYPTIWLVWKWITFDTWWIQVKPWNYMYEMKWDMSWAACVYALMKELDKKKIKLNIVASIPLAENHISSSSYKPSDILKSYSWKTVDIWHTDAEGRLVLADAISYISKNYKLDKIISIATLTWACGVALWYRYAWIMWDDEDFIDKLLNYSKNNVEKYWRLPFENYYVEKTKWLEADLCNITEQISAWSTMGAAFLYNFVLNEEKYTHIDIAGTAINSYEPYAYVNKWMTWFWVDSLSKIIEDLWKN